MLLAVINVLSIKFIVMKMKVYYNLYVNSNRDVP